MNIEMWNLAGYIGRFINVGQCYFVMAWKDC